MTQVTRKYNNKYINEAIPGTILRLNKTPYYPWPQDIQPNRNLKLIIQGIHKLQKSSPKHFHQEHSTAPYQVKSWGKPRLEKTGN